MRGCADLADDWLPASSQNAATVTFFLHAMHQVPEGMQDSWP
jgi:hypothetical protein